MPIEELDHFLLEQNGNHIDVKFKFRSISPDLEREIVSLLNTAYFGVTSDIRIFLGDLEYVNNHIILTLLKFAAEMKAINRSLTLNKAPRSFVRFLERLEMDKILNLES